MARKKNKYPLIEGLEIVDIVAEGKSMGRHNDVVVFVPMCSVGDIVNVQITNKRRRFMEGYVVEFVKKSADRVEPFCSHYGDCGGCKWQHLPYTSQLEHKQRQVRDQLERIGKIEIPEILPILGANECTYYRNKLEFTFSPKRWATRSEVMASDEFERGSALGFHVSGMFDKILDVEKCYLQPSPSNEIRNFLKKFCVEKEISFYNIRSHEGLMRNVVIRTASTGDVMIIVIFGYRDNEIIEEVMRGLKAEYPQINSLLYIVNEKLNDSYSDQEIEIYSGVGYIMEKMEDLQFKIGAKSFYQTNSAQAYELYKVTRDFAQLTGNEVVYDLYTGTGTIANFVASNAKKVIGIEYVPEAIEDAKVNSELNGISNTLFFAGDMKNVLSDKFFAEHGSADVIILDPPRAGIHQDVADTILRANPFRMVYVSCNPATQARDLAIFDANYEVIKVQPVDMFPHTHHVENVVLLERRAEPKVIVQSEYVSE